MVLFQMVESAEEAAELVSWTRYPPRGHAAIFGGAHDDYHSTKIADTIAQVEARTLNAVLIENQIGLANVDEIMAVEGVDVAHLGHADMSISMGIPGQFDHPKLQGAVDKMAEAAANMAKPPLPWRLTPLGVKTLWNEAIA